MEIFHLESALFLASPLLNEYLFSVKLLQVIDLECAYILLMYTMVCALK